ncbi:MULTISPECIES: DUF1064 domain-containing protein [unclassified Clostridioides]|uniref:DUF1064 domain-containing protein n=1 Tax=unclassified Clostridioides TaxID=2635829 RepID=UPI001D106A10|nr:DUF1064 domain-containing protein [Clostridioides sp. ZZV15-6388]MCC0719064.1 DUF1064 domain-containing protein [Clostridioides sp. ZZV14-6105]
MSKYNNKKIVIDGIKFDSKDESEYYLYLKEKKENGEIKDFGLQQKFELQPKFKKDGKSYRAITYTVDFAIYKWDGEVVYIDVKGYSTQQGELRKKLFDYKYQDKKLIWISKSKKYGIDGWIEYSELKKKRKENKKKVA